MRQDKLGNAMFTIMSLIWTAVAVFLVVFFFVSTSDTFKILRNGEKLEAIVIESKEDTSYTENGKHYWYMVYEYEYDGQKRTGKTDSSYDYNELLEEGDKISILYYDGASVQDGYELPNKYYFLLGFGAVSLCVGVGFGIASIKKMKKGGAIKRLRNSDKKTIATFVDSYSNYRVNNVPYYKIKYNFKDGYGIERTEESLGYCTFRQAEYLKALGKFEIVYDDTMSLIVEDLEHRKPLDYYADPSLENSTPVAPASGDVVASATTVNTTIKHECPSCGAVSVPEADGTCQYCGSKFNNF